MTTKGESGLSRWARRKAAVQSEQDLETPKRGAALPASATGSPATDEQTPAPKAAVATADPADRNAEGVPADLPDLDTLDYESDYAGFLSKDVSDAVRNIALRKLWRSNPLLANVDGLVDYDDDFTDAATVVEGMKSAYRIGRGMVQDEDEGKEEAEVADAAEADASQDGADETAPLAETADDEPETVSDAPTVAEDSTETDDPDEGPGGTA